MFRPNPTTEIVVQYALNGGGKNGGRNPPGGPGKDMFCRYKEGRWVAFINTRR